MNINIRDVDTQLHKDFKVIAAHEGKSIRGLIIELMTEHVKDFRHLLPPAPKGAVREV